MNTMELVYQLYNPSNTQITKAMKWYIPLLDRTDEAQIPSIESCNFSFMGNFRYPKLNILRNELISSGYTEKQANAQIKALSRLPEYKNHNQGGASGTKKGKKIRSH